MIPKRLRVDFPGSGGQSIAGRLDIPADEPLAFAIFAHCFTCTKDLKAATWIGRELVDHRIAVLRFDFAGLGESSGDFADTNFTSNLDDLVAAADFLRRAYRAPQILIGHSLGGTAVLVAAARIPETRAVVTIAAPSETVHLGEFLSRQAPDLAPDESAQIEVAGRPVRIKGQLLDDLRRQDIRQTIADLGRPLLIFHRTTTSCTSTTPGGSSTRPGTRRASLRSTAPITCSWRARATPALSRTWWPRGQDAM